MLVANFYWILCVLFKEDATPLNPPLVQNKEVRSGVCRIVHLNYPMLGRGRIIEERVEWYETHLRAQNESSFNIYSY